MEKSGLKKRLDVSSVAYMQLQPFLLGHHSPYFAGSWDSMNQRLFSLFLNYKWEERGETLVHKKIKERKNICKILGGN